MNDFVFICPCCQQDITAAVKKMQAQARASHARSKITPEMRKKKNEQGAAAFKKWRLENPEEVKRSAAKASRARTAESFKRQSESMRETALLKSRIFAELIWEAKQQHGEITEELEAQLIIQARDRAKKQLKEKRKELKKNAAEKKKPSI